MWYTYLCVIREARVKKRNLTISLPEVLLKKAKVVAARREKSLNTLLREALEEKVREDTGYKKARDRQLKLLNKGLNLGTAGTAPRRKELHARR